jgi:[acyl-carrier-protein] S-malonyltransferase
MKYTLLTQGQGAQFVHMGKDFHENFSLFRQTMEEAEDITRLPIRSWIYEGSQENLSETNKSQLSIYATTIGIYRVLHEVCPSLEFHKGIGLSLGEYSILTIANALSYSDCLHLVKTRGELMQAAAMEREGRMAAVIGLAQEKIAPHLYGTSVVANLNTPLQTVISGSKEDIEQSIENLKKNGAKRVIPLDVCGAFHSSLMMSAYEKFYPIAEQTPFHAPSFDVVMNASAQSEKDPARIKDLLAKQLISSVKLSESIQTVGDFAPFLELGPGTVVKGLVQKNIEARVISVNTVKDLKEFEVCAFL